VFDGLYDDTRFFEDLHEAVVICSRQFVVESANAAFCARYQLERNSLKNRSLFEIDSRRWDVLDIRTSLTNASQRAADAHIYTFETSASGLQTLIAVNMLPLGQEGHVAITVSDVRLEEMFTEPLNNTQLQLIFESAHVLLWDWDLVRNWVTIQGKPTVSGRSYAEPQFVAVMAGMQQIHPEDIPRIGLACSNAMFTGILESIEFRVLGPENAPLWLETRGHVFFNDHGIPIRATGVALDVTNRKNSELATEHREQLLEKITNTAPYMIILYDCLQHRYIYSNHYGLEFLAISSIKAISVADGLELVHPEDRSQLLAELYRVRTTQENVVGVTETRIRNVNGEWRWIQVRITPFKRQPDSTVEQILGMGHDITDQKQALQSAIDFAIEREKARALEGMIYDISHDFRTPLTVSRTSIYLLQRYLDQLFVQLNLDSDLVRRVVQQLSQVTEASRHVEGLVEALLDVARLDHLPSLNYLRFDLNALIRPSLEPFLAAIRKKALNVIETPLPDELHVLVEPDELQHAFEHIIKNAVQYTPTGGTIRLETLREDRLAIFRVSDTGMGIDASDLPHIFDPFYRADKARTRTSGSFGVGLSIARKIITAHSGRIHVESAAGQGSTFTVYLPLAAV